MAWSTPRTFAVGEVLTAANMNTYISNNLTFLGGDTGAFTAAASTTTSTTFGDMGAAGPAVTVTTLTSVLVTVGAKNWVGTTGHNAWMGFAVSGATTLAASSAQAMMWQSTAASSQGSGSAVIFLSGLTAGSNTFTAKYATDATGVATQFWDRYIGVLPLTV